MKSKWKTQQSRGKVHCSKEIRAECRRHEARRWEHPKIYPPGLYPGPTIQPRSAARRAAQDLVYIMMGCMSGWDKITSFSENTTWVAPLMAWWSQCLVKIMMIMMTLAGQKHWPWPNVTWDTGTVCPPRLRGSSISTSVDFYNTSPSKSIYLLQHCSTLSKALFRVHFLRWSCQLSRAESSH